jgi:hypothetical protein
MASSPSDDSRAAARLAGIVPPQVVAEDSADLLEGMATPARWQALATAILRAKRVRLVGIVPDLLIDALRRELEAEPTSRLPPLDYVTSRPELALNSGRDFASYANRWHVGFIGLRNLVMAQASGQGHFGAGVSMLSSDCLVVLSDSRRDTAYLLAELPGGPAGRSYVVCALGTSVKEVLPHVEDLLRDQHPICLREVRCHAVDEDATGAEERRLRIGALAPLGAGLLPPFVMRPITIVVVRCYSAAGLELVLKRRSPLTDTDDFGKLSLLSARLQEIDVATALAAPVSPSQESDEAALDDLWLAAGSPGSFSVPIDAFTLAAQREVSLTLGLDIDPGRFRFRGFQLVHHEESSEQQLGFMVYTLDLVRTGGVDELRHAMSRNGSNLVRVLVENLYAGELPLNRLLRQRRKWLLENCFDDAEENR